MIIPVALSKWLVEQTRSAVTTVTWLSHKLVTWPYGSTDEHERGQTRRPRDISVALEGNKLLLKTALVLTLWNISRLNGKSNYHINPI